MRFLNNFATGSEGTKNSLQILTKRKKVMNVLRKFSNTSRFMIYRISKKKKKLSLLETQCSNQIERVRKKKEKLSQHTKKNRTPSFYLLR